MNGWMDDIVLSVSVNMQARSGCPGPAGRWRLLKGPVMSGL